MAFDAVTGNEKEAVPVELKPISPMMPVLGVAGV